MQNFNYSRRTLIQKPSYWECCELGAIQQNHHYDEVLLQTILEKANDLYNEVSEKKHLNLRYIRNARKYIPEIEELINDQERLDNLSELAGTHVEAYPIGVISSIITFMSDDTRDGTVAWHADGVPLTELIPLEISEDIEGGELEIYRGDYEIGMALLQKKRDLPKDQLLSVPHQMGCSTLAQLIRVLHRAVPITKGRRVTLNLNLRSKERPFIDDNHLFFLGADNPDFEWIDDYIEDVRNNQLPAYMKINKDAA